MPAQSPSVSTTRPAIVNFTLNAAVENFNVDGPPFWYHAEPQVALVIPAGGPVDGGTNLTIHGLGFEPQPGDADVFTQERLRCLFDGAAHLRDRLDTLSVGRMELPKASASSWRNDTVVRCAAPPSQRHRAPYHNHGGVAQEQVARVVALRIALNGVSGSNASVDYNYYHHPKIFALEPRAGPWRGGTRVLLRGRGLAAHVSPYGLGRCRFGDAVVPFDMFNDTTGQCVAPSHRSHTECAGKGACDERPPGWTEVVSVTLALNGQDFSPVQQQQETAFTYYAPPRIHAVSPLGAADSGGTNVSFSADGLRIGDATRDAASGPTAPRCIFGNASELAWEVSTMEHGMVVLPKAEARWSFLGGWDGRGGWCPLPKMFDGLLESPRAVRFTVAMNGQDPGDERDDTSIVVFPTPMLLPGAVRPTAHPPAAATARATAVRASVAAAETAAAAAAASLAAETDPSKAPIVAVAFAAADEAALAANQAAATLFGVEAADASAEQTAALTPSSSPSSGGTRVWVHGKHLNAFFTDIPTKLGAGISACRFGETLVPLLPGARADAAVCYSPPHTLGDTPVAVTLNGIDFFSAPAAMSPLLFLYYASPQLLLAAPNGGPVAGGTRIALLGSGLLGGAFGPALAATRRCELCAHVADKTTSLARCMGGTDAHGRRVPGGGGYSSYFAVSVPDANGGPLGGPVGGASRGLMRGPTRGRAGGPIAAVGSCVAVASPNGTVPLRAALNGVDGTPSGEIAGEDHDEGVSSEVAFTFYELPQLHTLELTGGPVAGGSLVTIAGLGFDAFGATPFAQSWHKEGGRSSSHQLISRCRFGRREVPALDASRTHVICMTPPQPAVGIANLTIALNGAADDDTPNPLPYLYYATAISAVEPPGGPTNGGTTITVSGAGFASFPPSDAPASPHGRRLLCRFGKTVVNATLSEGDSGNGSNLLCVSPPTAGDVGAASLRVSLNGIDFPPTVSRCADTLGWTNGARPDGPLGCADYEVRRYCNDGFVHGTAAWAAGVQFNYPERHCCACGKLEGGSEMQPVFFYYEEPRLAWLAPTGGPTAGRTAVTIAFEASLPLFSYSSRVFRTTCRFGSTVVSAALTVHETTVRPLVANGTGAASAVPVTHNASSSSASSQTSGQALSGGLVCLAPQHPIADVLVVVSLNGQQYTRSDGVLYTGLPSGSGGVRSAGGTGDSRFATVHLLRGLRYTFYAPPTLLALRAGPTAGGCLMSVHGRGLLENVLHGGATQARCLVSCKRRANHRLAKSHNLVVDATLVGNEEARCIAPRASVAACMLRLSLNGGADWHAAASHGSRFDTLTARASPVDLDVAKADSTFNAEAVVMPPADDLSFVSRCTADNARAACLADPACGWCYNGGDGICYPCITDTIGQPTCADGPEQPRICREWTYVTAIPRLTSLAIEVAGNAHAWRMAFFVLRPDHPHAMLRVSIRALDGTNVRLFAKRGSVPEADDFHITALPGEVLALNATLPLSRAAAPRHPDLDAAPACVNMTPYGGGSVPTCPNQSSGRSAEAAEDVEASGSISGGVDTHETVAWYIGVQGSQPLHHDHFHSTHPDGRPLRSPLSEGGDLMSRAPHGGTFVTAVNQSSPFVLRAEAEFAYTSFDFGAARYVDDRLGGSLSGADRKGGGGGCGGDAARCGLALVGGAHVKKVRPRTWTARQEASAAPSTVASSGTASVGAVGGFVDHIRPVISLLRAGQERDVGAVWTRQSLLVHGGFETEFVFRIDANGALCALSSLGPPSPALLPFAMDGCSGARFGSNGFALLLQNAVEGEEALGCAGGGGGLLDDGEGCADSVSPALVLRFDTHRNQQRKPEPDPRDASKFDLPADGAASHAATPTLVSEEHNQLRLLYLTCPASNATTSRNPATGVGGVGVDAAAADALAPAPWMAVRTLLSSWGTTSLDDGRRHVVGVRYEPPTLEVRLDYELIMETDLWLLPTLKHDEQRQGWVHNCASGKACGAGRMVEFLVGSGNATRMVRAPAVHVLDSLGHARLGFAAGRSGLGMEQYEVHEWWFRRMAR